MNGPRSVLRTALAVALCTPLTLAAEPAQVDIGTAARAALGLDGGEVVPVALSVTAGRLLVGVALDGEPTLLDLTPHSVRAPGFTVLSIGADGVAVPHEPGPVNTWQGTVAGLDGSVTATLTDEGLFAKVHLGDRDLWIEPIAAHVVGAGADDHIVYGSENVLEDSRACGSEFIDQPFGGWKPAVRYTPGGYAAVSTAELACDADYEYYLDYGSVGAVQNRIESVMNTVNGQYESEVEITHAITTIIVRTSSNDPYSSTDAVTLLNQFRNEWQANQGGVQRDVASLYTGKEINGGTIGIAWLNAVCSSYGYNMVQSDFNGGFACATDLTAHELGHNWGADHCNCTSNTMNPYITCANTFSAQFSVPDIVNYRNSVGCLESGGDPPPPPPDDDPTSVGVGSITQLTVNMGKGKKKAGASVNIVDDLGGAVAGATVTVQFTGDINETRSGVTDGTGTVVITSNGTKKGKLQFTACVTNVAASLPWDGVGSCN